MKRSSSGMGSRWFVLMALTALAGGGSTGCQEDLPVNTGTFGGQIVISGGLRGSRLTIDQLDLETGEIRIQLGEAITDSNGRFSVDMGTENGLFWVRARGGTYDDLATGATIQLDDTDEIRSLVWHEILDLQDNALVSPIGNMIEARTMARLAVLGDMMAAYEETTATLHRHFGRVSWGEVRLWPLDQPAISPTEPVRAAFVHAALSVLARDIAADAGAGPQE